MKKRVLIPLFLLAFAGTCRAQYINPQYDTYVTYSLDANMQVYQTVVVEGTTTGSCTFTVTCGPHGEQCTITIPGCSTAVHTPSICNVVGGVGGCTTGPGYAMWNYISFQTTSSVQAQPGQPINASWSGQVVCSIAGLILSDGGLFGLTITSTSYRLLLEDSGICEYVDICTEPAATCKGNAVSAVTEWPGGICPPYLYCAWLAVKNGNSLVACIIGLCRGALYNPNVCS